MSGFAERFIEQGMQKSMEEGMQQGEARMLLRLLTACFGALPTDVQQTIESADADTLLRWSEPQKSAKL